MTSEEIQPLIDRALAEDIGPGDYTALACVPDTAVNQAHIIAKENGIIAGVQIAASVFRTLDPAIEVQLLKKDGDPIQKGEQALIIRGSSRTILSGERVALNFMQRLSGIATVANDLSKLVKPYGCRILDTRKTTPGLRKLEKWAVAVGGGTNHRMGLYDMMMIKENHSDFAGGLKNAISQANAYIDAEKLSIKIEVEARNLKELDEILSIGGIFRIMLDNFSIADLQTAVERIGRRYETEASGGITRANIEEYAKTGVDYISVGALTHSVKSLDLSLLQLPY